MEIKIGKKLWSLGIVCLLLGLTFTVSSTKIKSNDTIYDEKQNWAVIVCGGLNDPLTESFRNTTKHAYQTLKNLGYDDSHIYFLQDGTASEEGVDGITNKSMFEYAIAGWLKNHADENDDCFIYFVDHGSFSRPSLKIKITVWNYKDNKSEFIEPHELAEWIDHITCNICTIVIDTCVSGSFIRSLSRTNRIIITSTDLYRPGWSIKTKETVESIFSYHFFNRLSDYVSYGVAWEYADKQILAIKLREIPAFYRIEQLFIVKLLYKLGTLLSNPQIDDNGDGKGHGNIFANKIPIKGDGRLALETYP